MHSLIAAIRVILHLSHRTAGGVEVIGSASKEVEDAIDAGIAESIAIAHRCYGWTRGLSLRDYTVHIETGEDRGGVTVYRTPVGAYAGTDYDHGGWMYVGGSANPFWSTLYIPVIEGQADQVRLACRYESEHLLCSKNDKVLYNTTKTHEIGEGHPILHPCPDTV